MNQSPTSIARSHKIVLALMLLGFLLLSIANSINNPLFEPPDELQHYLFVRSLLEERQLPVLEDNGVVSQNHQAPLYYIVGSLLVASLDDSETLPDRNPFWAYYSAGLVNRDNKSQFLNPPSQGFPFEGTSLVMHILRLWSVLLGLGIVVAVWLLGKTLWPSQPLMVAGLLAFVVLNPMFIYITGAVNNDSLVVLSSALVLWLTVRGMSEGFSWPLTLFIGLLWAVALLSKLTGLMLGVVWISGLTLVSWREHNWRLFLSRAVAIMGVFFVVAGWWFIRNMQLYGEPFALERTIAVWGSREAFVWQHFWNDLVYAWTTFWGRFGYGQVPLPKPIYWFLFFIVAAAGGGLYKRYSHSSISNRNISLPALTLLVSIVTTLIYSLALFYYILRNPTGANGRYIYPALPAIGIILLLGLTGWLKKWSDQRIMLIAIIFFMAVFAGFTTGYLLPYTYARPAIVTEDEAQAMIDDPLLVVWNNEIVLLGTSVSPMEVREGDEINVTACWRANGLVDQNYAVAIHLLDNNFNSMGQKDSYHGQGTFPTSFWRPGDLFCDTYLVPASASIEDPLVVNVALSLYQFETGEKLVGIDANDAPIDLVMLKRVKITPEAEPTAEDVPSEPLALFDQGLSLVGYSWSAPQVSPGKTITLSVTWNAAGPLDSDYSIFAHLLDDESHVFVQADGSPRGGSYPTDFWGAGETIVDVRSFKIPEDALSGPTSLNLGFYILGENKRLSRADSDEITDLVHLPGPIIVDARK